MGVRGSQLGSIPALHSSRMVAYEPWVEGQVEDKALGMGGCQGECGCACGLDAILCGACRTVGGHLEGSSMLAWSRWSWSLWVMC